MPESTSGARPPGGRVSTGNPGVDAMLDGGLVPHRPYLIVGPSGTGKTTLALQFLCEGVRRGERVLLVTLEEPPNEVRLNHRSLAPDLDRVEVFDAIPDVMRYERAPFKDIASVREITPFAKVGVEIRKSPELASVEVTITALEQMLRSEVAKRSYSRIAIDSLTALQYFCMKGFDPVAGAQTFLRFLSDLRTTTVLTVESPLEDVESAERMLARGEVRLFRWELDGVTVRAIGVEKFRGSSHDIRLHPYRIGTQGIDVNLTVTISRDTRQIVEPPAPLVLAAPPGPTVVPATMERISDELRDLLVLGVDLGALRAPLEAALAAVRAGRSPEVAQQIARLTSVTSTIAAAVVSARPEGRPSPATADAYRRIAERAETLRVGVPPTAFPALDVLETQLGNLLALVPSPPAPAPAVAAPTPPAVPAPTPPAPAPTAPARPSTGPATAPTPAAPPPTARPKPSAVPARPPPMDEPPPLPSALPRASAAPPVAPTAARTTPARPASGPRPPTLEAPAPPPLPRIAIPESEPAAEAPRAVEPPPTPVKRRRRAAVPRKKAVAPEAPPALAEPGGELPAAPAPKPRRRAVRKRKAPPVVGATAEPLPVEEPKPAPTPPPEGG